MPKEILSAFSNWALMIVMAIQLIKKCLFSSSFFAPPDTPHFLCVQHVLKCSIYSILYSLSFANICGGNAVMSPEKSKWLHICVCSIVGFCVLDSLYHVLQSFLFKSAFTPVVQLNRVSKLTQ